MGEWANGSMGAESQFAFSYSPINPFAYSPIYLFTPGYRTKAPAIRGGDASRSIPMSPAGMMDAEGPGEEVPVRSGFLYTKA